MTIILYDLEFLNKPQTIISPNVAKIRYALTFKKLPFEVEWVNLDNIVDIIPNITHIENKRPQVPVLIDQDKKVIDSWKIALYLENEYPDTPSLFNGNIGVHKFFQNYVDKNIMPMIFKSICKDMLLASGPQSCQERFRRLKEADIGKKLEDFAGDDSTNKALLKQVLTPIHQSLQQFSYITGDQPGWADIVLAAAFTLMLGIRPDFFQDNILNAFEDQVIQNWWNNMGALS